MIRTRIQIGDGPIEDVFKKWGLIYIESDNRTEAPIKSRYTSSYAGKAGIHMDARTVQDAFDYTVTFLIECPNKDFENANTKIAAFNKALYTKVYGSDIRRYKEVTFFNDYKRIKIVGIPDPIDEPKKLYRCQDGLATDYAEIVLKIHVNDPKKCIFDMSTNYAVEMPIQISLYTDGKDIFINTTQDFTEQEIPVLLTCGVRRNKNRKTKQSYRSKYRWHVPNTIDPSLHVPFGKKDIKDRFLSVVKNADYISATDHIINRCWIDSGGVAHIWRTKNNYYRLDGIKRRKCRICYGVAIYNPDGMRLSNVSYFYIDFSILSGRLQTNVVV